MDLARHTEMTALAEDLSGRQYRMEPDHFVADFEVEECASLFT